MKARLTPWIAASLLAVACPLARAADAIVPCTGRFEEGGAPVLVSPDLPVRQALKAARVDSPPLTAAGAKGMVVLKDGVVLATRSGPRAGSSGKQTGRTAVFCARSVDQGRTWNESGVIVEDDADTDLGDGHLCQLASGEILYSYRRNRHAGRYARCQSSRLEVAASRDGGRTWSPHSVIVTADFDELRRRPGLEVDRALRDGIALGYWSSFLMEDREGVLHGFFDDEITPLEQGYPRHQWITRRTWDAAMRQWVRPVVVSRTGDPSVLARDGMPSVVATGEGRLLCVFESCAVEPPHRNLIRMVESRDGGASWNWRDGRRVVFAAAKGQSAICPWVAEAGGGRLVCVLATNEDWPEFEQPGQLPGNYHMDIKYLSSDDRGAEWGEAILLHRGGRRNYMPGVVRLDPSGALLFQWLEFGKGFLSLRGRFQ